MVWITTLNLFRLSAYAPNVKVKSVTLAGLAAVVRPTKKHSNQGFKNSRAPHAQKGKKDLRFDIADQGYRLVCELKRRATRPWYPLEAAARRRLEDIAARLIFNSTRFNRKASGHKARQVVRYVVENDYVAINEVADSGGMFTYELTDLGENLIR